MPLTDWECGNSAIQKELTQFHTLQCFKPTDPTSLTRDDQCKALLSLMFLTEKHSGKVKACACTNGSTQHDHTAKEEATAPTVTSEAIFIQGTIFAHEQHDVATCNIPGAFLQADNLDYILMCLDSILAELMVKVAPHMYQNLSQTMQKASRSFVYSLRKLSTA